MFQILWTCLGIFLQPTRTIRNLKKYPANYLLVSGLIISIASLISLYFGDMLESGVAPHTVFIKIIASYIGTFLFLSVTLTLIMFYRKEIYLKKFIGIYLASDFTLLAILPLSLIAMAIPQIAIIFKGMIFVITFYTGILKLLVISEYFKMQFSQVLVLFIVPIILLAFLGISLLMEVFNQLVVYF